MNIRILCIGDVVGSPGRDMVQKYLPRLKEKYRIDATIINGENAADGRGLTPRIMDFFHHLNVDIVTSGNHIWDKKDIVPYMQAHTDLLRPANFPSECPGTGVALFSVKDQPIAVINVQGRVFMKENLDCPFKTVSSLLTFLRDKAKVILVDFHAETTAEKAALAYYLDGKVSALFGTHTHVQTADERVLPQGAAFITDLGMVGALNSSLGMKFDSIIHHFISQMPVRFTVETEGPLLLNGVVIEVDAHTGRAQSIERISLVDSSFSLEGESL